MPRYAECSLRERKLREAQREQEIQQAFASRDKALEKSKRAKKQKKKTVGELFDQLNFCGVEGAVLRPSHTYLPKSYNLEKQLTGLVNHMFVRYPVPAFLYEAFRKEGGIPFKEKHPLYRQWFVTLAQGGSFPKAVRGIMTSKEACAFLAAPATNHIHENVWWAKMKMAGLPARMSEILIERLFAHYFFDDPEGRLGELIRFYARFHAEMDKVTFGEITDFLAWKLRQDRAFSLKGRTLSSVIKLTNEWHVLMQKAKIGSHVEWTGLEMPDWEMVARDRIWTVTELRNNRDLLKEGQKQRHCVYSYVQWCLAGRSAIFSLRGYRKRFADCTPEGEIVWDKTEEQTRITIEVNKQRAIVQARGLLNRLPTDEEKRILRHWAGEKGLLLGG